MEINIGMSECHKNVDNHYGSHVTVWIPRCAGREAFDGVEPLPEFSSVSGNWIKLDIGTLYNVILRIARNFLETKENIKISTHPF